VLADPIPAQLHYIDLHSGGSVALPDQVLNPDVRDRYIVSSLMEEAITSSQLEGAAVTRDVAKEMIRTGRSPRDTGERMILNNFRTMQRIRELRTEELTPALVFELHRIVTEGTLENPDDAGRFRRVDQRIDVGDDFGQVFHVPPPAEELGKRLEAMCAFANARTPKEFVHPLLRAIILHFWLAYDHPFVDGNGRTARALFYWDMLHHHYWMFEFISISEVIRRAPAKYGRAFLYTETDDNDLTYFILYHLEVVRRAIENLWSYVQRKTRELQNLESELRATALLNHRQQSLVSHALRHPQHRYTIESHQTSHGVVYETARTDLLDLADRGLLQKEKIRNRWHFRPVPDIEEVLRNKSA
jgi:Fic family protein